jgi:lipopolysaccharide/colanic/teichoic acid biosynthesis glycosyltransferase
MYMRFNKTYVPLIHNFLTRQIVGFALLAASVVTAWSILAMGRIDILLFVSVLAWLLAVYLTDKYTHKYPQRYFSYLFASHLKSAVVMFFVLLIWILCLPSVILPWKVLLAGNCTFVIADVLVSIPRRRFSMVAQKDLTHRTPSLDSAIESAAEKNRATDVPSIDSEDILTQLQQCMNEEEFHFAKKTIPFSTVTHGRLIIFDDLSAQSSAVAKGDSAVFFGCVRLNNVSRLNKFLLFASDCLLLGGYLVVKYTPIEKTKEKLQQRFPGILYWPAIAIYFILFCVIPKIPGFGALYFWQKISWLDKLYLSIANKRHRYISKAEVWGRLSYCGFEVISELEQENEKILIAKKTAPPIQNKKTSYYLIVSLEKVGLNGESIHTHKIRTMFPFSEFLQKRIFEDHGLAATGKFANDFRLTEYGKFMRKYWLDELPQLFDWLRGDIKLVGMRATSKHFLSLYPKELYDLYVQIKPGLIPPIFDESTRGFDQIVQVELRYLKSYEQNPLKTDIKYFFQTFRDIVFRGVRSK